MTAAQSATPPLAVARHQQLAALRRAHTALEAAGSVTEVKAIKDRAEALRVYARTAGLGLQSQNACAELRLRAEAKVGRLLARSVSWGGDRRKLAGATLKSLGISHSQSARWQAVGRVDDTVFEDYVKACSETGRELTTAGLLSQVRPGGTAAVSPEWPQGRFRTVMADPPWHFDKGTGRGPATAHYPTMSLDQVADLPVVDLAAPDAHLYLWVPNTLLPQAFEVVTAWGFTYRSLLTWVKPRIGTGAWFRNASEQLLFATRGSLPLQRRNLPTWFAAPTGRHSAKPEAAYELIEAASPAPRLELFARGAPRPGWQAWGDEAEAI